MKKQLNAKNHGIVDYVFSGIQLLAPIALGLPKQATQTYLGLGSGFLGVNACSDTPVGLAKKIDFRNHQKADIGFLAGLALLTATPMIRNNKKTLAFHLGFLAMAAANYLLTDYSSRR
ncbi:hypothetical protein [Pedobacter sp. SYP-B3415]|uniref:hypothetical protein n=1 Tax=Pedobacter sp. SYP-B3415 TaxID=2496641 RepID=UPI00101DED70|nr:hypothetical protein [Pedobacter sp. SYP-B3415]